MRLTLRGTRDARNLNHLVLSTGIEADRFFITTDFLSDLFRAASATGGSIPGNNWILDRIKSFIALIGLPVWRLTEERITIRGHREQHQKDIVTSL